MIIGDRVRELRKTAKLSQEELANSTGMTRRMVAGIELGENNPTIKQIEALALFFGVSADYLIFGETSAPNNKEREYLELIRGDNDLQKSLDILLSAKKNISDSINTMVSRSQENRMPA